MLLLLTKPIIVNETKSHRVVPPIISSVDIHNRRLFFQNLDVDSSWNLETEASRKSEGMGVLVAKVVSMCLLGGVSLLVGLLPLVFKRFCGFGSGVASRRSQLLISALTCFGGGVILTTCFTHVGHTAGNILIVPQLPLKI